MKMVIKCPVCNKQLISLEKAQISEADAQKYKEMARCDEHLEAVPEAEVEE